jgi:stage II sporulation protein P
VGSDARRPFPNWRQNYDFAVLLSERINQMYPGLSLGVRVKDGLYNQFLHPRAVLVEMGTTENSTEEAARSARLLADALADILAGEATVPEEPGEEPGVEAVWQETWNGRQEPGNLHYGIGIG